MANFDKATVAALDWLSSRAVLMCIYLLLLVSPQSARSQFIGEDILRGRKSVTVPFDMVGGFMIVKLRYNGIIPLNFIFDTGASNTILFDRTYADIFNVSYSDTMEVVGADIVGGLDGYIARRGTFSIADPPIKVKRDYVVLSDDLLQLEESLGIPVHGLLGSNFFKRLTVKINYVKRTLTFYDPSKLSISKKYEALPTQIINGKPYITCHVTTEDTNIALKMLLDTGADISTVLHSNTNDNIRIPENSIPGYLGTGLSGHLVGHIGLVDEIKLGSTSFRTLIANYQNIESDTLAELQLQRNGIVGNTLLSRFHIIIDFISRTVYLRPNKYLKHDFKTDKSGLIVNAFGDDFNHFVVHYVYPNSAADEADIKKGDIIDKVGRCKSSRLTLSKLAKRFQAKAGKEVKLRLSRNGELIKTTLTLRELIER